MNQSKNSRWKAALQALPRFLYNHNPFYPISAALTLYGIHRTVGSNVSLGGGMLLAELLCGYTALLAVVGYLIARYGRVWDDARTIFLLVALLLVALSAAFDRFLLASPENGAELLGLGGLFAVLVAEELLRSLRMRLPARYRAPYYLLMGFLFTYPFALAKLSKDWPDKFMPWAILLFPIIAAGLFLTLWPAARIDDRHGRPNGTPWRWPLYPWSLFTILLAAVALRSYSLGMTFEAGRGMASSFSSWFLVPLLLVAATLLLELSLTANNLKASAIALAMPLACLPLALCRASCPQSEHFGQVLADTIGSPVQLAIGGMALFYLVAWLRGLRIGEFAMVCCVALMALVDRQTLAGPAFGQIHPIPLLCIAAIELLVGARKRSSLRVMVSLTALGLAVRNLDNLSAALGAMADYIWHLNFMAALAVAGIFNDGFAKWVRAVAWQWLAVIAVWLTAASIIESPKVTELQLTWLAVATVLGAVFWYRDQRWQRLAAAIVSAAALLVSIAPWFAPALTNSVLGPGLPWLAWGAATLWAAILVSLGKSGTLAHLIRGFQQFGDGLRPARG